MYERYVPTTKQPYLERINSVAEFVTNIQLMGIKELQSIAVPQNQYFFNQF